MIVLIERTRIRTMVILAGTTIMVKIGNSCSDNNAGPKPFCPRLVPMPEIGVVVTIVRSHRTSNGLAGGKGRIFFENKLRAGCYEHLDGLLMATNQASLAIEPGYGKGVKPDPRCRGSAVGVAVVDVPGRAVGGLLDLLDTDQVTWYQIIHESDAQAFRFLTSFIVFQ